MTICKDIKYPKRNYCVGDLKYLIVIYNRQILAPENGSVDFILNFEENATVYAAMKTTKGVTVFDSANIERVATHEIGIRYLEGITAECWVEFNGKKLDVLTVENIDEQNDWLRLVCNERGEQDTPTNFA
jgi:SPP1 family predicted phage head-tail adaptor